MNTEDADMPFLYIADYHLKMYKDAVNAAKFAVESHK